MKNIFVVGCAAGQTLPLTGEGIRRSIHFGQLCGKIIQEILKKKITIREGQERYKKEALKNSREYQTLLDWQKQLPEMPNWKLNIITRLLSMKPILNIIHKKYEKI